MKVFKKLGKLAKTVPVVSVSLSAKGTVGDIAHGKNVVKAVRHGASQTVRNLAEGHGELNKLVGKIPLLGKPLSGLYKLGGLAALETVSSIASGNRIDKAMMAHIKTEIASVKAVGPYAQMVISFVPVAGQLSGALAIGLALANGQPIKEAMIAAIRATIPGGAAAQAVFDSTKAAISGQSLTATIVAAIPGDAKTKAAMVTALKMASDVAHGKKISQVAFDLTADQLPAELKKSLTAGLMVGQAVRGQAVAKAAVNPASVTALRNDGVAIAQSVPDVAAAVTSHVTIDARNAYLTGVGLGVHDAKPFEVAAVRAQFFTEEEQKAFDDGYTSAKRKKFGWWARLIRWIKRHVGRK